jgi:hypothetical protein
VVLEFVEICVFVVVYNSLEFLLKVFLGGFACEEMEERVGDLC